MKWVIVRIPGGYKLFHGDSDTWNLNSGIVGFEEVDNLVDFFGVSGSSYTYFKNEEGMTHYMAGIYQDIKAEAREAILQDPSIFEIVKYEDFKKEFTAP